MPPVQVLRGLVHPEEVVQDHIRIEDLEVTRENTVDLHRAHIVDHVLDHVPDLILEVAVAVDPEIEVTIARDNFDHIIIAALIINHVSRVSIIQTIVVVVTISKIVTDSIIINTTIALATDVAVVLIIVVVDADVAVIVVVDFSTVSRASAISEIGVTSEIVVPLLAIDTAIVVTLPIR